MEISVKSYFLVFLSFCLFVYQKYARAFVDVGLFALRDEVLPVADGHCADVLGFGGDVGCYAEACLSLQCATQLLQHLHITIRCLNKYLCLMFAVDAFFELFESSRAVGLLNREIALKSERLTIETTCHERQENA